MKATVNEIRSNIRSMLARTQLTEGPKSWNDKRQDGSRRLKLVFNGAKRTTQYQKKITEYINTISNAHVKYGAQGPKKSATAKYDFVVNVYID